MSKFLIIAVALFYMGLSGEAQDYLNEVLELNGQRDSGREIQILGDDMYLFSDFISEDGIVGVMFRKVSEEGDIDVEYFFHEDIEEGSGTLTNWVDGLVELSDGNLIYTVTNNSDSWFIKMDRDLNILDSSLVEHPMDPEERFSAISLKNTDSGIIGIAYTNGDSYSQASIFTLEEDLTVSSIIPNVIHQYSSWIYDLRVLNDGNLLISGRVLVPTNSGNFAFGTRTESFITKLDIDTGEQMWYSSYGTEELNFKSMNGAELPNGNILAFLPWSTAQNGVDENGLFQDFQSRLFSAEGVVLDSMAYFSTFKGNNLDVRYNDGKVYCHGQKLGPNDNSTDSYFLITDTLGNKINLTFHEHLECWGCRSETFHMDFKENGNLVGFGGARLDTLDFNYPLGQGWLFETDCQGRTETPETFIENIQLGLNNDLTELVIESDSLLWLEELTWSLDGDVIASHVYDFSITGEYELGQEVLLEGRYCNEEFTITLELTEDIVSVYDIKEVSNEVAIYPNPVQDKLMIQTSKSIQSIAIIDSNGRIVNQNHNYLDENELDVSGLSNGFYQLVIQLEGKVERHRFVK